MYQPQIYMERDIRSGRRVAAANLSQCSAVYMLVEDEPSDVLQVGTLLIGRAIHDGLQLHCDERSRLGDQVRCSVNTEQRTRTGKRAQSRC
jgi:hypothetical protein